MIRKFTLMLFLPSAVCLAVFVTSFSSGPAGGSGTDRTGSPFSDGTCNSCHFGGDFGTDVSIELLENGEAVDAYEPGKQYLMRVEVQHSMGNPSGYAFQAVAVNSNNEQAGTFTNAPDGINIPTLNARQYAEHSRVSNSAVFELDWIAPEAGTGNVTFYGAGNAVDGNGGTSGDLGATSSTMITEADASSSNNFSTLNVQVYPNPVQDWMNIKLKESSAHSTIVVYDLQGRMIFEREGLTPEEGIRIHTSQWLPGIYIGTVRQSGEVSTFRLVKE